MTARKSVASYGSRFVDLLAAASERKIDLKISQERGVVMSLRQQLYRCRAAMRRENHYLLDKVEAVMIPEPDCVDGWWYLRPQPVVTLLDKAMDDAGVERLSEANPIPDVVRPTPVVAPGPSGAEQGLLDWLEGK